MTQAMKGVGSFYSNRKASKNRSRERFIESKQRKECGAIDMKGKQNKNGELLAFRQVKKGVGTFL